MKYLTFAIVLFLLLSLAWAFLTLPVASPSTSAPASQRDTHNNANVQWGFTQAGGHLDGRLATDIGQAQSEIDAAIYAINRQIDVSALSDAYQRCKCVRLISDAVQSAQPEQNTAMRQLVVSGIPIKVDSHTGIMHMKVVEIDRQIVLEGSFNVTNAASTINDEILVRVESSDFANAFAAEFDSMWNDTRRFKDWTP